MRRAKPVRKAAVTTAVLLVLAMGSSCWGQTADQPVVNPKIALALRTPADMRYDGIALEDVVSDLKKSHGVEIRIDAKALSADGVPVRQPITGFADQGISLGAGLLYVLRQVGLVCVLQEDSLVITSPKAAEQTGGAVAGLTSPKPPSPPGQGSPGQAVFLGLRDPTVMEFIETPLNDVIDYLRDLHETAILVDWAALRNAKLPPQMPITLNVKDISLRSALHLVLGPVGLACARQDEFLVVTTPEAAEYWGRALRPATPVNALGYERIDEALKSETRIHLVNARLQDLLDYVSDLHGIPVVLERDAVDDEGIKLDKPATIHIEGHPLDLVLRRLLDMHQLTYTRRHEVLLITTTERAGERYTKWTYTPTPRTVRAEVVRVEPGTVVLWTKDGEVLRVPFDRLSPEDQQRVRDQFSEQLQPRESPPAPGMTDTPIPADFQGGPWKKLRLGAPNSDRPNKIFRYGKPGTE